MRTCHWWGECQWWCGGWLGWWQYWWQTVMMMIIYFRHLSRFCLNMNMSDMMIMPTVLILWQWWWIWQACLCLYGSPWRSVPAQAPLPLGLSRPSHFVSLVKWIYHMCFYSLFTIMNGTFAVVPVIWVANTLKGWVSSHHCRVWQTDIHVNFWYFFKYTYRCPLCWLHLGCLDEYWYCEL